MSRTRKTISFFSLLILVQIGSLQQAIAEDKEKPKELQGFEIEAISLIGEEISGVVLDRESIEQAGIDHVDDLSGRAPGLFIASGGSSTFGDVQTIRGIGNTPFFSSPGILFYIDGIPAGDASTLPLFLEGIESIKILRGPQGHLYGRNAPGGVVEIKTQRPAKATEHLVIASHGELNSNKVQLLSSGPLKGSWAYSLAATRSSRDGYIQDLNFGHAKNNFDYLGGRFSIQGRWNGLDILAGTSLEETEEGSPGLVPWGSNPLISDTNEVESARYRRNSQWVVTSKSFEWGKLTSTSSRSEWQLGPHQLDLDMTPSLLPAERAFALLHQKQEVLTKGLEIQSHQNKENAYDWKAGLFYLDSETSGLSSRTFPMLFADILLGVDEQATDFTLQEESLAFYTSGIWHKNESIDITFGLRLDRTQKKIDRTKYSTFALSDPGEDMGMTLPPPVQMKETWTKALPHLGATWHASDQVDIFTRGTLGYKPGGYSAYGDDLFNPVRFDEEINRTLEAGISLRSHNGAAAATFTVFRSKIQDYQFEKSAGGTDYVMVNAEQAQSKGMELELMSFLSKNLMLTGSYGYTDANFDIHSGYQVDDTGFNRIPTDFSGNRLPYSPRHTLNLAAQYFEENGTFARLEWRSIGETFFNEANTLRQPTYGLLNARTGRTMGNYRIQFFAQNLLDKDYNSLIIPLGGPVVGAATGTPRIIGVQIERSF